MTDLLEQAKKEYAEMQKKYNITASFDEIDKIFFISDAILRENFVSTRLPFMISKRIVDTFSSWNNYMHKLLIPNPGYIPDVEENKVLTDEDKELLQKLIAKTMYIISVNTNCIISLTDPSEIIDESVAIWNQELSPGMGNITQKIKTMWKEKKAEKKKNSYEGVS